MSKPRILKRFTVIGVTYLTIKAESEKDVKNLLDGVELVVVQEDTPLDVTSMKSWQILEDKMH